VVVYKYVFAYQNRGQH